MQKIQDQDGKSKTSSAVDQGHYPEMDQKQPEEAIPHGDIVKLAHEIWKQRGCPPDSAEWDWKEAEEQLRQASNSKKQLQQSVENGGSVQR